MLTVLMIILRNWAFFGFILSLTNFEASADLIVDQEFMPNLVWAYQPQTNWYVGQSFTAARSGQLKRIEVTLDGGGSRQDVMLLLTNSRSRISRTMTIPYWKLPRVNWRWWSESLYGVDVSALNFSMNPGDVCEILFQTSAPPTVQNPYFYVGCAGPPGVTSCNEVGVTHYERGMALGGGTLSEIAELDGDSGIRTFLDTATPPIGPPVVYEHPGDTTRWLGETVYLQAFANGAQPISYTWHRATNSAWTAVGSELNLGAAALELADGYYVVMANSMGSVTSKIAAVEILDGPRFYAPPTVTTAIGQAFETSVSAEGKGTLKYAWYRNGNLISSAATLTISSVRMSDAGIYQIRVSDDLRMAQQEVELVVRDDEAKVKWSVPVDMQFPSQPTVSAAGKIYVANNYNIFEWTADGIRTTWNGGSYDAPPAPILVGEIGVLPPSRLPSIIRFSGEFLVQLQWPNIAGLPAVQTNGIAFLQQSTNAIQSWDMLGKSLIWSRTENTVNWVFDPVYDPKSGVLFCGLENRRISAFDGNTGERLWDFISPTHLSREPCIGADGAFYVGADSNLYCFEGRSGHLRWQHQFSGNAGNGISVTANGRLYFGADGKFYAIDGISGQTIWSKQTSDYGFNAPTLLSDNTVMFWNGFQLITVSDGIDGHTIWDYFAPAALVGPPSVGPDGTVYFTAADNKLYALKTTAPLLSGPWSRTRGGFRSAGVVDSFTAPLDSSAITLQPESQGIEIGQRFELRADASGGAPLQFQWIKDGTAVPGGTSKLLEIPAVGINDTGYYWMVASNAAGSAISQRAFLTVVSNIPVQVSTIAGSGDEGYSDGANALLAKFAGPDGGGVTKEGVIFFADGTNHVIRYILQSGEVGTFAGTPMVSGYREDVGTNALFNSPLGLQIDAVGDLLVADYGNHRVRKVLGLGYRSTSLLAGDGTPGLKVGVRGNAEVNGPNDLVQLNGRIYFTEFFNHTVRCIDSAGLVTVLAGSGAAGFRDGEGAAAQFNGPAGITTFGGDLYVTDWANNRVRKVTTDGVVTTIAGSGALGFKSGLGTAAELGTPNGICADAAGNLYFTEYSNSAVRRIDTNGWVRTVAGTGAQGFADGDRMQAMFNRPGGICMHPDGSLIVMDTENYRVRRIVLDGKTNGWTRASGFLTADLNPTVKVFGNVGERYRIETRDQLGQGEWSAVTSIVLEQSPTIWVDTRADGGMQRIYRAVKE
jgi:sugar lactone lactonase YvrE